LSIRYKFYQSFLTPIQKRMIDSCKPLHCQNASQRGQYPQWFEFL